MNVNFEEVCRLLGQKDIYINQLETELALNKKVVEELQRKIQEIKKELQKEL